jgi:hypothetical protein
VSSNSDVLYMTACFALMFIAAACQVKGSKLIPVLRFHVLSFQNCYTEYFIKCIFLDYFQDTCDLELLLLFAIIFFIQELISCFILLSICV